MTERIDKFMRMPLDSPDRPIKVTASVPISLPPEAEGAKRFVDLKLHEVTFKNEKPGFHWAAKIAEGVMIAHVDSSETVAFVDNFRHPLGRFSRELPGGGIDPEETSTFETASIEERELILKRAAIREFREEVGRHLCENDITRLLPTINGAVGFADLSYNIFHGEGGLASKQSLDDGEDGILTHDRYSITDATEMIGYEIVDAATTAAVMALALEYGVRVSKRLQLVRSESR